MTVQSISRREYTAADVKQIDAAERQLFADHPEIVKDPRIITDKVDDFFQTNRQVPVTLENIYRVVGVSSAEGEWYQIAQDDPGRAHQLAAWLATQGKPGQLVNSGDAAFDNLRLLLITLRGYEINSTTLSHAEDRLAHASGKKLRYVPEPRRTEPRSEAGKADDPNRKPGQFFSAESANEPEWVKRSRERSQREAQEAASKESDASVRSRAAAAARQKAESLQGGSHAETDQLRRIFVTTSTNEIDWQATLASRLQMQQQFDKQRAVRRFIR